MSDPNAIPPSPEEGDGPDATAEFVSPAKPPPATPSPAGDSSTSELADSPTLGADAAFEGGASIGPYRLVRKLGQGGMGTVWEAVHVHLHKAVAVKVLSPRLMKRPEVIARFYREMKAAGRVTHPNVVQAYDAGEFGGVHFLAMELVEGFDLHRHVAKRGPLSVPQAARALRQAALGLAAAHAEALVHRDVKPMNLLVSKSGRVKILDLGLARVAEEAASELLREGLTLEGHVMGTPDYMAPEQWDDPRTVGPAADLYSLGCTLFFLLTGKPPFGSERHSSAARKMAAHLAEEPPDLALVRPDVPTELNAIYLCLVAKRPEDRPRSASELAASLAPFTGAKMNSAGGGSSLEPPVARPRTATLEDGTEFIQSGPSGGGDDPRPAAKSAPSSSNGKLWAGCVGAIVGCTFLTLFCLCSLLCAGLAKNPRASESEPPSPQMKHSTDDHDVVSAAEIRN